MSQLDDLITEVRGSSKYRRVSTDLIRSLGAQELAKRPSYKESVKATKNKLHQIAGAYLDQTIHYADWLVELQSAFELGGLTALRPICQRMMMLHSSTRERLPILTQFYPELLAGLPPVRSIIDIACGLNPLAIPWMSLHPGISYRAIDIYEDMMDFLHEFIAMCGLQPETQTGNVLESTTAGRMVDLAFVLKAIPCLEREDSNAGVRLLDSIDAEVLIVSFPVHSLGGRGKGMTTNYESRFMAMIAGKRWTVKRYLFGSELVFVVNKR